MALQVPALRVGQSGSTIPIAAQQIITQFNKVLVEGNRRFIGMGNVLPYILATTLAGQHGLLLGKPGTAKTTLLEFIGNSLAPDSFFKETLDVATGKEDLVGPNKMTALARDEWLRKWSGVATNHFVFLDEVGAAPIFIRNMLKSAMTSRYGSTVDEPRVDFPLHSLWGASNETFREDPAVWDRFLTRIVIHPLTDPFDIWAVITGTVEPIHAPIDLQGLPVVRATIKQMIEHISDQVKQTWVQRHPFLCTKWSLTPTTRRIKDGFAIAAGWALMQGRAWIEPGDLIVFRYIYPDDPTSSKQADIQQYFSAQFESQNNESEFGSLRRDLAALKDEMNRTNLGNRQLSNDLMMRVRMLKATAMRKYGGVPEVGQLQEMEDTLFSRIQGGKG